MGLWGYGHFYPFSFFLFPFSFILYPLFPNLGYNSTPVILNKIQGEYYGESNYQALRAAGLRWTVVNGPGCFCG